MLRTIAKANATSIHRFVVSKADATTIFVSIVAATNTATVNHGSIRTSKADLNATHFRLVYNNCTAGLRSYCILPIINTKFNYWRKDKKSMYNRLRSYVYERRKIFRSLLIMIQ